MAVVADIPADNSPRIPGVKVIVRFFWQSKPIPHSNSWKNSAKCISSGIQLKLKVPILILRSQIPAQSNAPERSLQPRVVSSVLVQNLPGEPVLNPHGGVVAYLAISHRGGEHVHLAQLTALNVEVFPTGTVVAGVLDDLSRLRAELRTSLRNTSSSLKYSSVSAEER